MPGKMSIDELMRMRPEVLSQWRTGEEVKDLDAALAYQRSIPEAKRFSAALAKASAEGRTLMQPRAGVCLIKDHIRLLKTLETDGEADLLPTTIDSYTRQNRYAEAQEAIEESMRDWRSLLNGFPAVNHGVAACRDVTSAVSRPIQVRHGTPDAALLCEITLAGGFTAFEGGPISYNIPYAKNFPLEKSIASWRYVDRLVGLYAESGVIINREPFGPLTGTLVPPSISNAIAVIEALLAAEQGVRDITVGYGQCGNVHQDIAAILTLKKTCREYLDRFGHGDVALSTVFHQWMGGFPVEESKAFAVIAWGSVAAVFSGSTKVITKTPHEAMGVPTAEANVAGLKATKQILNMLQCQEPFPSQFAEEEADLTGRETKACVEATLALGEGDLAAGVVRAFQAGVLDVPFAPTRVAAGAIMPVRDLQGAVRLLEFGNLPFGDDIKSFHRKKLEERARAENRAVSFQMVTDDIYAISKGRLVGKPR